MKEQFLAMIDKKILSYDKKLFPGSYGNEKVALKELRSEVEKMEEETVSKKDALDFAYWYHSGLTNRERRSVEEEFEKYMNETI